MVPDFHNYCKHSVSLCIGKTRYAAEKILLEQGFLLCVATATLAPFVGAKSNRIKGDTDSILSSLLHNLEKENGRDQKDV